MTGDIPAGWLAKLMLNEVEEGHYYKDGDLVQIRASIDSDENGHVYSAYVLRTQRVIHFLLRESQVQRLQPLEQLALVPELQ